MSERCICSHTKGDHYGFGIKSRCRIVGCPCRDYDPKGLREPAAEPAKDDCPMCEPGTCPGGAHRNALWEDGIRTREDYLAMQQAPAVLDSASSAVPQEPELTDEEIDNVLAAILTVPCPKCGAKEKVESGRVDYLECERCYHCLPAMEWVSSSIAENAALRDKLADLRVQRERFENVALDQQTTIRELNQKLAEAERKLRQYKCGVKAASAGAKP